MRSEGGAAAAQREVALDAFVVPALLLLVARDLALHDPPRVFAWRLLHDDRLTAVPGWLEWLLPGPPAGLDRDPIGLALATLAVAIAAAYLWAALAGARVRWRAALLGVAATLLVAVPTLGFVAMGAATDRPYGQDGGVVQLPLALDRILSGRTPYAADYSDSILGKQARVSEFWQAYGGNPILRHHAYLPGTHLLMAPAHLASRATFGWFDPRTVTLFAWAAAGLLAARVSGGGDRGLAAAAAVLVSPLVYWQQIFGANDVLTAAVLLGAVLLHERARPLAAAAALGFACATKHMAWPYAPFLLVAWSGARGWDELRGSARRSLLPQAAVAAAVFAAVVLPVAALDFRAFWSDVVLYNAGLATDNYPLGGTPGIGLANVVLYAGGVSSLRDDLSLGIAYLLLLPLGLWLLRVQMREGGSGFALLCGSAALIASVYVSRVAHPNYLIVAAMLAPAGLLMHGRRAADVVIAPLLMLALAVEIAEQQVFRATWEQAAAFGLQRRATGLGAALWPDGYPALTSDPLGLLIAAALAGLAAVYLWAGLFGAGPRLRRTLAGLAIAMGMVLPAVAVSGLGRASGAVRAQDPWMAAVSPREPVVEAWSQSFRSDPPRTIEVPDRGLLHQGTRALLAALGRADARWLLLLCAGLAAALLSALAPPERQALALAGALLTPAAALGVAFGSPAMIGLAGLLAAGLLASRAALAGSLLFAAATAVTPIALFGVPVVLRGRVPPPRAWIGLGLAGVAGIAAFADAVGPGVGLGNLALYRGEAGGSARIVLAIAQAGALGGIVWVALRARVSGWLLGAGGVVAGLALAPAGSPHEVTIALGLLAAGAVAREAASERA